MNLFICVKTIKAAVAALIVLVKSNAYSAVGAKTTTAIAA
jgi:hypothetical protein